MDVNTALTTLTAVVATLAGVVPVLLNIWKKVSAQNQRLDRFWRARLLRGYAEAIMSDLAVEQVVGEGIDPEVGGFMPIALVPDAFAAYEPIADKLRDMKKKNPDATEIEFAEMIEDRFGAWLARFVCAVLHVSEYSCIVMAISVAEGTAPVDLPPKSKRHRSLE